MKIYNYAAFRRAAEINRKGNFRISITVAFGEPEKINRRKLVVTQPFNFNSKSLESIVETMNKIEANCARMKNIKLYDFLMKEID